MGKSTSRKRIQTGSKLSMDGSGKPSKADVTKPDMDKDSRIFIDWSQVLKEEGKKLLQRGDHEGAMIKYEKALKLLPSTHTDVAYLRTHMAACYMQMGMAEYPQAVTECNLALQVTPKYSKALLRRASCYEALNQLELAYNDVNSVLAMEPNNTVALEIAKRVKQAMETKGIQIEDKEIDSPRNLVEPANTSPQHNVVKEKETKTRFDLESALVPEENTAAKFYSENVGEPKEKTVDKDKEKKAEEKVLVTEDICIKEEPPAKGWKQVRLCHDGVFIWTYLPVNCSIRYVRDIVKEKFPGLEGVLIHHHTDEGSMVPITTNDELRASERLVENSFTGLKLNLTNVSSDKEPLYEGTGHEENPCKKNWEAADEKKVKDWMIHFSKMFKNHVDFQSVSHLDLHEIEMRFCVETLEEAGWDTAFPYLYEVLSIRFGEMIALTLFNLGNAHLSFARKLAYPPEGGPFIGYCKESAEAYGEAFDTYTLAGSKYEEALKSNSNFYEGSVALGIQQFELAKLIWGFDSHSRDQVKKLYNDSLENMEHAQFRVNDEVSWIPDHIEVLGPNSWENAAMKDFGLVELIRDVPHDKLKDPGINIGKQISFVLAMIMYEKSIFEYEAKDPDWMNSLDDARDRLRRLSVPEGVETEMIWNISGESKPFPRVDNMVKDWTEKLEAENAWFGLVPSRFKLLFKWHTPGRREWGVKGRSLFTVDVRRSRSSVATFK